MAYQPQAGPQHPSQPHQLLSKAQRVLVVPSSASAVSTATPFSPMEQMEELNVAQSNYCFAAAAPTEQQLQGSTAASVSTVEPIRAQVNLCAQ